LATSILIKLFYRNIENFKKLQGVPNSTNNQHPQFIMGVLAQAKMVMNSFGNRNFMQPMGSRLSMHSK
jgi:hypothetical protein